MLVDHQVYPQVSESRHIEGFGGNKQHLPPEGHLNPGNWIAGIGMVGNDRRAVHGR